ncbi:MAG: SpoIIE family protein phosphatase [Chlorobi bacterium]|nr:SpoIIE family protein phosphatase [Chlorobiota bacterium]
MEVSQNKIAQLEKQIANLKDEIHLLNIEKNVAEDVISELEEANNKAKTQAALANILQLSVKDISLEEFLQKALEELLQIPWLLFQSKGSIFLTNAEGNLEMVAQKGLGKDLLTRCKLLKPGQCLCGKTLLEKKYRFCNHVSSDHEIRPENIQPHGHYNFPLNYNREILGVLNLYVNHKHQENEFEVNFLKTVSIALAHLIKQRQFHDKLTEQSKKQDIINQKLFAQNLEIDQQRIEIQKFASTLKEANDEIIQQKAIIEKSHKSITDSINYAKGLQNGLLPSKEKIDTWLNNYFILFKPKDVVSGDFYYVNKVDKYSIIVAGDCTGHGVHGAFLTILGITYINEIIKKREAWTPAASLDILREKIKETFLHFGNNSTSGMDISFCAINTETNVMQYAGANNPVFIIRNNELIEYLPTRNPIGFYPKEKAFENQEIQLFDNDMIYLFSDGYSDQFGGTDLRKFTKTNFKNLLLEIHTKPLSQQKEILEQKHMEWRGDIPQTDDIVVFGVKWQIS